MVFQKGIVTNPNGNPNLAFGPKTGPKTDEGKLRTLFGTGIPLYRETPLLKKIRQCDKCPIGAKEITLRIGDKIITRNKPADCSFYEKGKTECVVPVTEWVGKVKVYYKLMAEQDSLELHRALILEAVKHSKTSEEVEIIKKGHPGFYTKEYLELALKHITEYNKIVTNQATNKHLHLHQHQEKGDLAERIIDKIFPEEEKNG